MATTTIALQFYTYIMTCLMTGGI